MMKFARIGRLYKLIKLTRLIKMLKIVKNRGKILKQINDTFQIGAGFERLFFFIFLFLVLSHIVSCLWVITANFSDDLNKTWLAEIKDSDYNMLYLTSFYFTVETITTVGYGDYGPQSSAEKMFCIGTMIIGVIAFSFASGSLSSIL